MPNATIIHFAVVGAAFAALHFGGLWISLRRLPRMRHPGLAMALGLLLRFALALAVLAAAALQGWRPLVACAAGFAGVQLILVTALRPVHPLKRPREGASP